MAHRNSVSYNLFTFISIIILLHKSKKDKCYKKQKSSNYYTIEQLGLYFVYYLWNYSFYMKFFFKKQQDPAQVYSIQERIGKGSFGEVFKAYVFSFVMQSPY